MDRPSDKLACNLCRTPIQYKGTLSIDEFQDYLKFHGISVPLSMDNVKKAFHWYCPKCNNMWAILDTGDIVNVSTI